MKVSELFDELPDKEEHKSQLDYDVIVIDSKGRRYQIEDAEYDHDFRKVFLNVILVGME